MCGIVGIVDDGDKSSNLIESMTNLVKHRGPDDSGHYMDENIVLGHRRLSIIDIAGGHQPMLDISGAKVITYNGEIYNFREIRCNLEKQGYGFRSNCDTEVVLNAFDEYGPRCLSLFNGMFAFAIWDTKTKTLFAARDRLGIKPFYYIQHGNTLAFASEIKALLLLPNIKREINKKAIHYILRTNANLDRETCIKGIFKLPPGHFLQFSSGKLTINPYWQIPIPEAEYLDEQVWAERIRKALFKSVERRMVSDVPVGATLSGGLDSSSLVAIMSRLSEHPVKTFTAGYGKGDTEFEYAAVVAEKFKTNHKELIITPEKLEKTLPTLVWHLEQPMGQTGAVPLFHTFREASRFIKVLLVGEGADEVFAGYLKYKALSPALPFTNSMRREIYQYYYTGAKPHTLLGKLAKTFWWRDRITGSLFLKDFQNNEKLPPDQLFDGKETLNRALRFDQQGLMVNWQLKNIDSLSMANSVEARVPFLDHELIELAMKIPSKMKCHGLTEKYILRKTLEPILPACVVKRKKFGQTMRFGDEMTRSLDYLSDLLLKPNVVEKRDLFKLSDIENLRCKNGRKTLNRYESMKLWTVILTEIWARLFLDRPINASPPGSVSQLVNS